MTRNTNNNLSHEYIDFVQIWIKKYFFYMIVS